MKITEIGSEFWDIPTAQRTNRPFPKTAQWYLSGRSALKTILCELHGAKSVSLPSWCCDSIVKPFAEAGFQIRFYPVYWQNGLIQEIRADSDVLFLMDFFGYTSMYTKPNGYTGIVIRDVTHSLFSASYNDANYYFGSLRKWCGVWTGGFAWAKDGHKLFSEDSGDLGYRRLREKAMQMKAAYIDGEDDADKGYLNIFEQAEDCLEYTGIAPAAQRDIDLARRIDDAFIRFRRRENAKMLQEAFADWLIFQEMQNTDCPMFVPVLVPNGKRDRLRRFLIDRQIYCPIHWPVSEYHRLTEQEHFLFDNELSLVCDQRYQEKDMLRLIETIQLFMEK